MINCMIGFLLAVTTVFVEIKKSTAIIIVSNYY